MAGAITPVVRVQRADFDMDTECAALAPGGDTGALVTFTGLCRDEDGTLGALELEHYPGMAEAEMTRIANEAIERWPLTALAAIHRTGRILPGENIVLVIAGSAHRGAAFEAASFVMDFLKSRAPFWKKEHRTDGSEGDWVEAKDGDTAAMRRW
ncbi:molybdenum cofactor biosynthesis protein MoaE [Pararhizobium mangrovi]|uniref:Molybdopterin synthase catalytic subunit n=1 Tax=Pararhizobium mangrovi TaxID=2590452 RepID=A0A506UG15_9HYPH|nr:molybdenum cofactor biosynthesis protein MoaE [Pararhizobium mangrovi]TPW32055.1 molybdenum cofactor biosynthesis protein MoaE [Pararhizobium mangrovi]